MMQSIEGWWQHGLICDLVSQSVHALPLVTGNANKVLIRSGRANGGLARGNRKRNGQIYGYGAYIWHKFN